MKNTITIFTLLISLTSIAQNKHEFGVNLGATLSNVRGNQEANQNKSSFDVLAGVNYQYYLNEKTAIVSSINYERKSFGRTVSGLFQFVDPNDPFFNQTTLDIKSTLVYISIPVLMRHYFGKKTDFFINYGPFLNFLSDTQSKINGDRVEDNSIELFQSLDAGLSFGIGKKFKINDTNALNLEVRNNFGLANINRVRQNNQTLKVNTNSLNLIATWQFKL